MTKIDPETRIPDPIDLDRAEEARLRADAPAEAVADGATRADKSRPR